MKLLFLAAFLFARDYEGQVSGGPPAAEEQKQEEAAPQEMTLDDARMNFSTVIDSFLAVNTREGIWNFKDKKRGIRKLALKGVEERTVKATGGGPGRYSGVVAFNEAGAKAPVRFEMTVDMSGAQWKVVGAKLLRQK